ncbi:MAG: ribonuclease J [Weeksellaceae bacterium]
MDQYKVRFVPLGGVVGVTKNMYLYELYNNDELQDIIIVDCGMGFPSATEMGVDLIIPDISYLMDKKDKIRAILLTHGHEDHIGALPFHYVNLGKPPMYGSKLTKMFVTNKFKEYNESIDFREIEYKKWYEIGGMKARFIHVAHSIPDPTHILIKTPIGVMYHGPDFKFDLTPPYAEPPDFHEITSAGADGVLCLLSDALGSEREGLTLSEAIVGQTFEDEMRKTKGKFIMTTFSSNISRIRQCVEAAIKFNRKIIFLGRSMRQNTEAAAEIGYLPIPFSLVGKEEEVKKLPGNKVCIIAAGSQGQYGSALSKISQKRNANIKIAPGDKVIFSSDPIPGNENEVYSLIEEMTLQGADVVYSAIQDALHASGHGNQEDIKFLARFTNPKYFIPIGGTVRHQRQYQKLMIDMGFKKETVFMLMEGDTVEFSKAEVKPGKAVETKSIYVDAYGVGDVGNVVLRDRQTLSSEGMVVSILIVDATGKLVAKPRFFSRGFVFEKKEEELFDKAAKYVEKLMKSKPDMVLDVTAIKRDIGRDLETFFYKERGRKPLVTIDVVVM